MSYMKKTTSGFTIVELLIVIVVIAILATISVVAYTGIQNRAHLSKMQNDFRNIEQAIEMYRADSGTIPECPIEIPLNGCNFSLVTPLLHVSGLPTVNPNGSQVLYVGEVASGRWAVRFAYADGAVCKIGRNMYASWWSSAASCW